MRCSKRISFVFLTYWTVLFAASAAGQSYVYLSDLDWDSFDRVLSGPWKDTAFRDNHNKPVLGESNPPEWFKPISFDGVEYAKGITWFPNWGTSPNLSSRYSHVIWALDNQYSRLHMWVRCDDYDQTYGADSNYWQKIEYEWVIADTATGEYLRGAASARPWKASDPCNPGGSFVASELNDPPDPPAQVCDAEGNPIGDLYPPVDRPAEMRVRAGAAAVLRIFGDGVLLQQTPEIYGEGPPVLVDLDVSGIQELKIQLDIGGNEMAGRSYRKNFSHAPQPVFVNFFDQIALADARLFLAGVTNTAPVAVNDTFVINEDSGSQALDVLADNGLGVDHDPEGDPLSITQVSMPNQGGTVSINGSQDGLIYEPLPNFDGNEAFSYTISDGLLTHSATVTVTVLDLPDAPNARDDTFFIHVNSSTNFLDVLADNGRGPDEDLDGDPLMVVATGMPSQGGAVYVSPISDGLLYTPSPGFTGAETFTYTVSDSFFQDTGSVTIVVKPDAGGITIGESGTLTVVQSDPSDWFTVNLQHTYVDPVVIMQPLSHLGDEPAHIRIRNITTNRFEFKVEEWEYLDLSHFAEDVSYLVMERGIHTLSDGTVVEAGKGLVDGDWTDLALLHDFTSTPVVLANAQTITETQAVVVHMENVTSNQFSVRLREQEAFDTSPQFSTHAPETVGYIAAVPGGGVTDGMIYEIGLTSASVTHSNYTLSFSQPFSSAPAFSARCNTESGTDPHHLRYEDLTSTGVKIFVEEEESADSETTHVAEVVGYWALEPLGLIQVFGVSTNQPPVAQDDLIEVIGNTTTNALDVLADHGLGPDTDADGDPLSVVTVSSPDQGGAVFISAQQTEIIYTPMVGFVGLETFTYTVSDGLLSDAGLVTVTVLDPEDTDDDGLPDAWELEYFGTLKGADTGPLDDYDGDGVLNLSEYVAGTDPSDHQSYCFLSITGLANQLEVSFVANKAEGIGYQPTQTRTFTLQRRVDLIDEQEVWVDVSGIQGIVGNNQQVDYSMSKTATPLQETFRLELQLDEN